MESKIRPRVCLIHGFFLFVSPPHHTFICACFFTFATQPDGPCVHSISEQPRIVEQCGKREKTGTYEGNILYIWCR